MIAAVRNYFAELNAALAASWNLFWFTPAPPTTLAAIRIAAGALAFYSVATYAPDLHRWFDDDGMLPRSLVSELYRRPDQWLGLQSLLYYIPDSLLWPFYGLSLAAIGLFTLGVGGRAMAIAAAVATISFFSRAPLVIGQFEHVLAMLLIYLCIGRASDAFSIASLWRKRTPAPPTPQPPASSLQATSAFRLPPSAFTTISLRLIQVHLALIYLMMGWAQLAAPESAWWSGEGVWLAAARPGMSLVDLSGLADYPRLVAAWSHAITLYLLAFPALIWNRWTRPLMLAWGAAVWISFAVASGWVMFCAAMLTGLIAFLWPPRQEPT
jgi:hypothetical protein